MSAAAAAPAGAAEYYWGCTYSYGHACFEPHYHSDIQFLVTMDPDHAHSLWPVETSNRYKAPVPDGRERCVGSAIWWNTQVVPWVAGWGQVDVTYQNGYQGYGMIGTCVEYYQIALYQMVNWGTNEP